MTPPEEKPAAEAPAKIESPRAETTKVPGSDPKPSALAQCPNECHGSVSSEFISALRARGGQTRGCYNRALRKNPALEGKLVVRMKVGITGEVCSVEPKDQTLQDQEATECILDLFRSAKLPAPQGGCVETAVPLNFVSKH